MKNQSREIEFILLGLTDEPQLQIVIFNVSLPKLHVECDEKLIHHLSYLAGSRLKTPRYFFLQNLSLLEVSLTTTCIPRFLIAIVTKNKFISYNGCASQLFFFLLLCLTEFYLLAAMSFDCYVAICKALHYLIIMSKKVCYQLVLSSWAVGFLVTFPPVLLAMKLEFCASRVIDYFVCDTSPVLQISYTDNSYPRIDFIWLSCWNTHGYIIVSDAFLYIYYQDHSKHSICSEKNKSFPHMFFHMIVVSLTYGSCIFTYMKPSAKERVTLSKGISVIYTSVALY